MNTPHRNKKKQPRPNGKGLHPRNLHRQGYDFPSLVKRHPPLIPHVKPSAHGNLSIDFADPLAVKTLNAALLKQCYNIAKWDMPDGALCPPIPGRADYIHCVAELLGVNAPGTDKGQPHQPNLSLLDIGTGASGIYPLLACQIYGWECVGSDINPESIENVASIINSNPTLKGGFKLRTQHDKNHIFEGVIQTGEFFDVSVCNPPFHASPEEALRGSRRKLTNLARNRGEQAPSHRNKRRAPLNFGGAGAELWCKGGERLFLKKMIKESLAFSTQCRWFTCLISKIDNVKPARKLIHKLGAIDVREIEMVQGNKVSRILAWTFIEPPVSPT